MKDLYEIYGYGYDNSNKKVDYINKHIKPVLTFAQRYFDPKDLYLNKDFCEQMDKITEEYNKDSQQLFNTYQERLSNLVQFFEKEKAEKIKQENENNLAKKQRIEELERELRELRNGFPEKIW